MFAHFGSYDNYLIKIDAATMSIDWMNEHYHASYTNKAKSLIT